MIERLALVLVCLLVLLHEAQGLVFGSRFVRKVVVNGGVKSASRLHSFKPELTKLIAGEDLSSAETEEVWGRMLQGESPVAVGALLALLRAKGETAQEVAGMVRAMRTACNKVSIDGKLLDIVGTGGDGADTINISTAASVSSNCQAMMMDGENRTSVPNVALFCFLCAFALLVNVDMKTTSIDFVLSSRMQSCQGWQSIREFSVWLC